MGINTELEKVMERLDRLEGDEEEVPIPKKYKKLEKKIKKIPTRKLKKNFITILKINENRELDIQHKEIKMQTVVVDGVPRLATGEFILSYKKKPVIIQPNWSVKPFSSKESYDQSMKDGSNTVGYRLLLERMRAGILDAKKKIGIGLIIGVLVVLAIVAYGFLG